MRRILVAVFLATLSASPLRAADADALLDAADLLTEMIEALPQEWVGIEGLVRETGGEAEAMIGWVTENIVYRPYAGTMRGPDGTLATGAGNALDQALLLGAALNAAGFEAQIVETTLGEAGVDAEGNPTFEIKGKAKAHAAREQLVLVIHKGDGFELMPIPRNDQGLGGGKYFLLNASQAEVAGQIGNEKFALKQNGHQILSPKPDQENGIKKLVQMKAFFRINGNIQPFFSSMWRFNEDARTIVFFFNDSTGHLKLHTIRSFVN